MTFVYGIIHYSPATGGPTACRGAGLLAGLFTLQSTSYFNLNLMFVFEAFDFFAMSKFSVSGVFGVWKIIYTILRINKCIQNYPHGQTNILRIEKLHAATAKSATVYALCSVQHRQASDFEGGIQVRQRHLPRKIWGVSELLIYLYGNSRSKWTKVTLLPSVMNGFIQILWYLWS